MLAENKNLALAITDAHIDEETRKKLLGRLEVFGADNQFYKILDDYLAGEAGVQNEIFFTAVAVYSREASKLEDELDKRDDDLLAEVTPKVEDGARSAAKRDAIWEEYHSRVRAVRLDYEERLRDAAAELIRSIPPLS